MPRPDRAVLFWLLLIYILVFLMILLGGATRLTGSGLSIVDWRPLMGALPPLNETQWNEVFGLYQLSPQFAQANSWMNLEAFRKIFMWEYFHRLLGRLIGLVVFVPWIVFLIRKRLGRRLSIQTLFVFTLGGMQGLLGWYMVKSGLVNVPEVSHYRLAAHLCLAFLLGQWVLWLILDLCNKEGKPHLTRSPFLWTLSFTFLLSLQVVYGAFMAGKKAGWLYSSFPKLNGEWIPSGIHSLDGLINNWLNNPIAIHFIHRTLAYAVLAAGVALGIYLIRSFPGRPRLRKRVIFFETILCFQVLLGILTVVLGMPISVAVAHQGLAFLLLSIATTLVHEMQSTRSPSRE